MREARNRHNAAVTGEELASVAKELGIDVIGAAPAAPYAETERQIVERRERGLFADLRFTISRPEESCHPELLLPDARSVISAALCYYARAEPTPDPPAARPPRQSDTSVQLLVHRLPWR